MINKFTKENLYYLSSYQEGLLEKFNKTYEMYEMLDKNKAKEYAKIAQYLNLHFKNLKPHFQTFVRHLVGKTYDSLSQVNDYIDGLIKANNDDYSQLLEIIETIDYISGAMEEYMNENHIYEREKLWDMVVKEIEEKGSNSKTLEIVESFNNCIGEYIKVDENTDNLTGIVNKSMVLKEYYEYAYDQIDNMFFDSLKFRIL